MPASRNARAVLYIRVSDEDQLKGFSLEAQERECREFCDRQGLAVGRVFRDEARTAKSRKGRAQLTAALDHIADAGNKVDALVVWNTDRFARNVLDHLTVRELLATHGCRLLSATETFEDSPTGRLFETIKAALNQFDNEERAKKTRTGMEQASRSGFWMHKTPIGYESWRDDAGRRRLRPHPRTAGGLQVLFDCVAGGLSQAEALRRATAAGLRDEHGRRLRAQRLRRILENPVYRGVLHTSLSAGEVRGEWDPLVSDQTWHLVQNRLGKGKGSKHLTRRPDFPLKGLVLCGQCGRPHTACWSQGKKRKYPYYRCPGGCKGQSVRAERLEDAFCDLLGGLRFADEAATVLRELVVRAWTESHGQRAQERARLDGERTRLEARKERLLRLLVAGTITEDDYRRQTTELTGLLGEVEAQMREVGAAISLNRADLDHALSVLFEPLRFWRQSGLEGKQALQSAFFPEGLTWLDSKEFEHPITSRAAKDLKSLCDPTLPIGSPKGIKFEPLFLFLARLAAA